MWKLITRRMLAAIMTLFFLSIFAFSLLYLAPGDPAERILQARMNGELPSSPDVIVALKQEMGLNVPAHELYMNWIEGVLHGDLGYSYITRRPATAILSESLIATAQLVSVSIFLIIFFGLTLGLVSAWKENSAIDSLLCGFVILGVSIPNYVIAFVSILIFAVGLKVLPVAGRSGILSMLMPAASLSIGGMAMLIRMTRSDVLEEMGQNYVVAARAKGLPEGSIFINHIFRNALPPLVTYIGLELGWLFSGTVIIEEIFAWPGIGRLLVDSVLSGDIPLVQSSVLMIGTIFIITNIVVDILCIYIDPRITPKGAL